jgi:predicted DCC family thiol-disulfide oxidoreductase YuxK
MSTLRKALARIEDFFLAPASPLPLAALRIGLALTLLVQAWLLRSTVLDIFAGDGLIQGDLARALSTDGAPRISSLLPLLSHWHITETAAIHGFCAAYVIALGLLALGLFTRGSSIAAWLLHWVLMNTGETTSYGVDLYAHVFLFYLMFMPAGAVLSLDAFRRPAAVSSSGARLALRVLQLHLCISYLCSAIEKGSGIQWWNGELMWRALSLPVYHVFDMSWLAGFPHLSQAVGVGSLVLEGGYFAFMWPRRTRPFWVAGMIGLHLGIAGMLGLGCFGVVMAILNFCVWAVPSEPAAGGGIVLFDGVCGLCDRFVQFVIARDPAGAFRFAPLQPEAGGPPRTIVLIEDGRRFTRSSAVLRIARGLPGAWPLLSLLLAIPAPLRDLAYDFVAKRRYRWFGRYDACRLPAPGVTARFLDGHGASAPERDEHPTAAGARQLHAERPALA